ncbi:MAG: hypothetical protein AB7O96_04600 [Pseudobdellovibrionaceae bacterium]
MKNLSLTFIFTIGLSSSAWGFPLIVPKIEKDSGHKAAFEKNWKRYPSPETILQTLKSQFPNDIYADSKCKRLDEDNRQTLGDNMPALGKPLSANPDPAFAIWYSNCVFEYIVSDGTINHYAAMTEIGAQNVANNLMFRDPLVTSSAKFSDLKFSNLSQVQQEQIVKGIAEKLIGPEEIWLELEFESAQALISDILEQLKTFDDKNPSFVEKFKKADTIIGTYQRISYLILIQDILQY